MAAVALMVTPAATLGQSAGQAEALAFMSGCWRIDGATRQVDEQWMAPAGGLMLGMSRTVADGRTVEFEFVQIRELPAGLAYIAKPSNQPEATFMAVSQTSSDVVFENLQHDFPQRIRYRRQGDALHASIEGTLNGKSRTVNFPYVKVSCPR